MTLSQKFLIGIDLGTTNVKGSLFSENGELISTSSESLELITNSEGCAEQDPEEWWAKTKRVIRGLDAGDGNFDRVVGIGISSQGGTLVLTDEDRKPLANAITWLDKRSQSVSDEILKTNDNSYFYRQTGWQILGSLPLSNLYWLKANRPDLMKKAKYLMMANDYLIYKLTGISLMDPSNACMSMLFNVLDNDWDDELLDLAGVKRENLSPVSSSGVVAGILLKNVAEEVGLPKDVIVANAAHDQYACALGANVVEPGDILLSTGTAWVILAITEKLIFDEKNFFAAGRHVIEDRFGLLAAISTGGVTLEWFIKNILGKEDKDRKQFYAELDENIQRRADRQSKIVFLPYLSGSSAPSWNKNARALFAGLSISTNAYDLINSIMESLVYELMLNLEAFKDLALLPRVWTI